MSAGATSTTAASWREFGGYCMRTIGGRITGLLVYLGDVFLLTNQTVRHCLRGEVTWRETFAQLAAIGVGGLPLVAVTVAFSGMVFGVYAVAQFQRLGVSDMIGVLVSMSMTREVAPVLAATVIAARSGSAIAAEVGTMKITEQLDALRALATDPVEYLAVPRYCALVTMLPLLALVGMATGVWGAGVVCNLNGISWRQYMTGVWDRLTYEYILIGLVKAMIFGALIAISSLRQGLRAGYGSESVGRATTQAVVNNILWIHAANLLLAMV